MSDFNVIGDIGETLKKFLENDPWEGFDTSSKPVIRLKSPKEMTENNENKVLSIYLYQILENPYLKNEELKRSDDTSLLLPPLTLDLFYLITPYFEKQPTLEKRVLGKAMQIFYDNSILTGTALEGSLSGIDEEIRLFLNPLSVDELSKIWSIFPDIPYRISVGYIVTPVRIDSIQRLDMQRVLSKEVGYYDKINKREEK